MPTVVVVDDEAGIRDSLCYALSRDGFDARGSDRLAGVEQLLEGADLLILDLMLPDGSGLEFLREFRRTSTLPVIVLTSRSEEVDRVVGLELGADDYVVKPFSPRELVARVRAVLRRSSGTVEPARSAPTSGLVLRVERATRRAYVGDAELLLSRLEFELLATLVASPDRVFERDQLLHHVWGRDCVVGERTVDVHVKALRMKIEAAGGDPRWLETVRGVGYRLREPSS